MKTNWAVLLMAGLLASGLSNGVTLAQDSSQEELLERIKKLEERIAELEGKSKATSKETEPAGETTPGEPAAPEAETSDTAPILDFFKATKVSGYVDAYYGYSSNDPDSGIVDFRGLDTRHNSFQFDLAKIVFDRPAGETNSLGYRIDLVYGPAADTYHSFEPVGGQQEIIKNIQQAYVSYIAPVGDGLTVDVGKFGTFVGAEVLDTIDNFQYQQSILFGFAQPYYHTGVRTSYSVSDTVDVGFYLVNGWNNST
ncbi:MAG: outer membrane beta-barrel protein, partial [Acidobacteriota bacterium]|nr:outer membrane beta-barrel protein [Acidobacteriota bacterium]